MKLRQRKWNAKWLKYKTEKRHTKSEREREKESSWLISRTQRTKRPSTTERKIEFLHHRICFVNTTNNLIDSLYAIRFKEETTMRNHFVFDLNRIVCMCLMHKIQSARHNSISHSPSFWMGTFHRCVIGRWQEQYSSVVLPLFLFELVNDKDEEWNRMFETSIPFFSHSQSILGSIHLMVHYILTSPVSYFLLSVSIFCVCVCVLSLCFYWILLFV